jgi:hypothetical protein
LKWLFISHSSADRNPTDKLIAALQGGGAETAATRPVNPFRELVDYQNLKAGDPWPRQLHEWMARCHAGLLLLTENSVKSPWVLKEATILSWRFALQPDFKLFVVRSPEVTDVMLRDAKFGPLDLQGIQQIGVTDPEAIAQIVRQNLPADEITPVTLFDRMVTTLAALFEGVKPGPLRMIAEAIRVKGPDWDPDRNPKEQYVEAIAERLITENLGQYNDISELIDALAQTAGAETIRDVLRHVAPIWVEGTVAGVLPPLTKCTPRGIAAINGKHVAKYTGQMYVSRAHALSLSYVYFPVPGAHAGDIVAHVKTEVCKWYRRRKSTPDASDEEVLDELNGLTLPFYVALPSMLPTKKELELLQKLLTSATFIIWTGAELKTAPDLAGLVSWLEPPVNLATEEKQMQAYTAAQTILFNKQQGF